MQPRAFAAGWYRITALLQWHIPKFQVKYGWVWNTFSRKSAISLKWCKINT